MSQWHPMTHAEIDALVADLGLVATHLSLLEMTDMAKTIDQAAAALAALKCDAVPRELVFTLREAQQLVVVFGGDDAEVTVRKLAAGVVADDPKDPTGDNPSPAGLWAHFTDYPEEGCLYLGPCEVQE